MFRPTITAVVAASDILPALAPQPSFSSPHLPHLYEQRYSGNLRDLGGLYRTHQERRAPWSEQTSRPSLAEFSHRCKQASSDRQAQDGKHMSYEPVKGNTASETSPESRPVDTPSQASRDLPPITSSEALGFIRNVPQGPTSIPGMSMRPTPPPSSTPPEQRIARPIGVENLLNPSAGATVGASSQRHYGERAESPRTVLATGVSRQPSPSLPSLSMRRGSNGEISLPSITPPLMNAFPHSRTMTPRSPTSLGPAPFTSGIPTGNIDARQSPFVLPRDQGSNVAGQSLSSTSGASAGLSNLPSNYNPIALPNPSSPRSRSISHMGYTTRPQALPSLSGGGGHHQFTSSRSASPSSFSQQSSTPAPITQPGPQSFFSGPFAPGGPTSTMAQGPFDKKATVGPGAPGQNSYPMMTLETESGPIQVPVDVQAASRVADEKRKRNATASHRFRQRRKEKEHETATNIASLESRVRELADEREYYQRERDFLQDVIARNRIALPPRPASPRRRRHASLGGPAVSHYYDPDSVGREESRNTRRRTSAYVAPQGPHALGAHDPPSPPMPSYDRMRQAPAENNPPPQQQSRSQAIYPPAPSPYHPEQPRRSIGENNP